MGRNGVKLTEKKTETDTNWQKEIETGRNRVKLTETDTNRQKQTKTDIKDRNRQKQAETRIGQEDLWTKWHSIEQYLAADIATHSLNQKIKASYTDQLKAPAKGLTWRTIWLSHIDYVDIGLYCAQRPISRLICRGGSKGNYISWTNRVW